MVTRPACYTHSMRLIKQIAHLCLGSTDLKKSEHFYCTTLGLTKHFRFLRDGKEFGFYLDLGNQAFIEIFEQPTVEVNARNPIQHLCLQVDDIAAVIAALRAQGYAVSDQQLGADQSWQCWTTDPHGVRIEMHQYTSDSSQVSRRDCVMDTPVLKKP